MSDPKRWSESGSDVDPVLRSVMRYSRTQGPTPEQTRELLRGVRAGEARGQAFLARLGKRRWRPVLFAIAAVVASGASWAAYRAFGAVRSPVPQRYAFVEPRPKFATPAPRTGPPRDVVATEPAATTEPVAPPARVASRPARQPRSASSSPPPEDELSVLEEARALLSSNPAAALALTRDHAVHHPTGSFTEEREALAIEALHRLHRTDEAAARLRAFEAAYPRSPYRRRLGHVN